MKDFTLLFFNVLLTVIGQILFKHGMNTVGRINNVRDALEKLTQAFLNPYVLSGIAIYGFTTLVWLVILSRVKLSIAYPMLSSGYVLSILFSWMLFQGIHPQDPHDRCLDHLYRSLPRCTRRVLINGRTSNRSY